MKFLYCCVLLLAVFAASQAYSATYGRRNGTDTLISRSTEVRGPVKNAGQTVYANFPRSGVFNRYNITVIYVIDNFRNSSGATPYLRSGGPNYLYANIDLVSQKSQGVNSTIEIWGKL